MASIEDLERELADLVHYRPDDRPALDRVLTRLAIARATMKGSL